MSSDESAQSSLWERLTTTYLIYVVVTPLILGSILAVVLALTRSTAPETNNGGGSSQSKESGLETAVRSLSRQTDPLTCRTALQQINGEVNDNAALRPPALTKDQKNWLRQHVGLNDDDLAEVENTHYTRLDGLYLDRCFLFRDAANTLEVKGVRGQGGAVVQDNPLEEAKRAFAYAMREVRLRESEGEPAPPSHVLRRGHGNSLERALVFLALLEQVRSAGKSQSNPLGCLLETPDDSGRMKLWACGVVIGDDKEVYLFDPRLGLPLPGPKGEGVATLAQARQQAEILTQLNAEKLQYPVTLKQVQEVRVQLVCSLSSLSPRMRHLEQKLLAPTVRVRLAREAARDLDRLQAACATGSSKATTVTLPNDKATLLRRFMPVSEGGVDTSHRKDRLTLDMAPWQSLPPAFLDQQKFPANIGLGRRVREFFAAPFIRLMMDPGSPRDRLLRGRYRAATEALVREREHWQNQLQQRANATEVEEKAGLWLTDATHEYAQQIRAKSPQERELAQQKIKELWDEKRAWPIYLIINGAAAGPRNQEVAYQLGLCAQEEAEQLQARLDVQKQAGGKLHPLDVEKAHQAWQIALNNWKRLDEDYPAHPDRAAARRLRGRAEEMLGDHQAALATWKETRDCKTDLEKMAALFLARRLEKQMTDKN